MPLFNFGLGNLFGMGNGAGPTQTPPLAPPPPRPPIMDQMSSLLNSAPNTAMGPSGVQTPMPPGALPGGPGGIDWSKVDFQKVAAALGQMGGGQQQQQRPMMPQLPLAPSTSGQMGGLASTSGMNPQMLAMLMKLLAARGGGGMPGGGAPPSGGGMY